MRVIVLGSGVIGVTSAYYLARAGHQVTVIDRQPSAALETSFANAGQISPGYAAPWAAPGIPFKAIKWLVQKHAPLSITPDTTLFQLHWMYQMLMNCNATSYAINKSRMVALAEYSRSCLQELRETTSISYEGRQKGTLQVFRTQAQLKAAEKDITVLEKMGVPYELLSAQELGRVEPGLCLNQNKLTGGLRLPEDETGDCYLFTTRLADMAQALGVTFRYGTHVSSFTFNHEGITSLTCGSETLQADAYVVALGSYSTRFLKGILSIPVYPVKGYSLTLPILNKDCAPLSTVLDETYKIAITRFDDRIRVGGMAELVGFNTYLKGRRRATLKMVLNDLFPGSGDLSEITFWTGLRPMTPDGTPIIGRTHLPNLFLNTGHGTLGWTMSCGSGQVLADIISEKKPAIDVEGLSLNRYG